MDVPRGADGSPLLPEDIWQGLPPAAQAVLVALADEVAAVRAANAALAAEVRDLQARLGQNSSNSSRPPSSDPPQTPRRPPAPPTGRSRGAQPGHVAHQRAVVPPERVDHIAPHWPAQCAHCQAPLLPPAASAAGDDFVAHQVTELPPVRAVVTEHRLYRVTCSACGQATRATLPPDVPAGAFGPRLQATV
ncbi:MAG: IS66 family transposase zinc-finger binding domain-containing protein, partial [Chloroflexi bacterium]|nr:IS66 family transposase zinc-finger binding domain-containing protein [Chloroflexota bacterium]